MISSTRPTWGLPSATRQSSPPGKFVLIPETAETRGHSTHTWAIFWQDELRALLARSE